LRGRGGRRGEEVREPGRGRARGGAVELLNVSLWDEGPLAGGLFGGEAGAAQLADDRTIRLGKK